MNSYCLNKWEEIINKAQDVEIICLDLLKYIAIYIYLQIYFSSLFLLSLTVWGSLVVPLQSFGFLFYFFDSKKMIHWEGTFIPFQESFIH